MKKIAIIGAGLSGLTLADHMADIADVTLFEKHHCVSGRMASREHEAFAFDHGAQFFTVKHPAFAELIQPLIHAGVVAHWHARFVEVDGSEIKKSRTWEASFPHYVGVPNMASIGAFLYHQILQRHVALHLNTAVAGMQRHGKQWHLIDADGKLLGCYDWVITAMPAEQAARLMPTHFKYWQTISQVRMLPCFALMLGLEQPLDLTWDAAHVTNSVLSWISLNASKPGRNPLTSVVAMSHNDWAEEHFNQPDQWVIDTMLHNLARIVDAQINQSNLIQPNLTQLKKWHYANAQKLTLAEPLMDTHQQLACCGDWCISGRVESAFISAKQLSESISTHL